MTELNKEIILKILKKLPYTRINKIRDPMYKGSDIQQYELRSFANNWNIKFDVLESKEEKIYDITIYIETRNLKPIRLVCNQTNFNLESLKILNSDEIFINEFKYMLNENKEKFVFNNQIKSTDLKFNELNRSENCINIIESKLETEFCIKCNKCGRFDFLIKK